MVEDLDFERWYVRIHPRLVAAMLLATGRADDAADVADEACVRAYERWARVSSMASPDGWTFRVAYNLVRRRGRRRSLEQAILRRTRPAPPMPAPAGEAWAVVAELPDRQRQVVVLRFVADLPEAEIAQVLGISRGTVSSTLADAKDRLAGLLQEAVTP